MTATGVADRGEVLVEGLGRTFQLTAIAIWIAENPNATPVKGKPLDLYTLCFQLRGGSFQVDNIEA